MHPSYTSSAAWCADTLEAVYLHNFIMKCGSQRKAPLAETTLQET